MIRTVRQGYQRDTVYPCIQTADLADEGDIGVNRVPFPSGTSRGGGTNSATIDIVL
jgi:hypothetical protein